MSFSHKAFALDWDRFTLELAPILFEALVNNAPGELIALIGRSPSRFSDPYEGIQLDTGWSSRLQAFDVQEAADFALTLCYAPGSDFGLAEEWLPLDQALPPSIRPCMLGVAFGPPERPFDPGRMGSYFQSPMVARESLERLRSQQAQALERFTSGLAGAVSEDLGVYVTF